MGKKGKGRERFSFIRKEKKKGEKEGKRTKKGKERQNIMNSEVVLF